MATNNGNYVYGYPEAVPNPPRSNEAGYVYGYPAAVSDPPKSKDPSPWFLVIIILFGIGFWGTFLVGVGGIIAQGKARPFALLDSLTVSNLNITGGQISGEWEIGLNMRNPQCPTCTTYFDRIVYSVAWSGVPELVIATGESVRYKPAKKRASFYLKGSANLGNTLSGVFMRREIVNNGSLAFEISLSGSVEFGVFELAYGDYDLKQNIKDIRVPLLPSNSTPNTLMGAYHNITGL